MGLVEIIQNLDKLGIVEIFLPFVLIFTVLYSLLNSVKLLSKDPDDNKKYSTIIALVMSLLVIFGHVANVTVAGIDVVDFINKSLPGIAGLVVAFVLFFIVLALVMPSMFDEKKSFPRIIVIAALIIALYIFGDALGWFKFSSKVNIQGTWLGDPSNQAILLVLFAFIVVVWVIVGGKKDSGKSGGLKNMGSFIKWLFGNAKYE
jgi:hypothetical protein